MCVDLITSLMYFHEIVRGLYRETRVTMSQNPTAKGTKAQAAKTSVGQAAVLLLYNLWPAADGQTQYVCVCVCVYMCAGFG